MTDKKYEPPKLEKLDPSNEEHRARVARLQEKIRNFAKPVEGTPSLEHIQAWLDSHKTE